MVKRKSVKTDTAIKVIAIGILGYIGLKTIPSLASGLGGYGGSGGSGGYMGSGTDLSSIPAGFFTETPPVFNITNTPPDSFFSTPSLSDGETKKDVSVTALGETVTPRGIDITPNTNLGFTKNEPQPFNLSNPSTWVSATPVENNPLKKIAIPISNNPLATGIRFPFLSKYNIWNNDNGKKLGGFLASAVIPFPLNLLVNAPAVAGGCSGGSCPYIPDTNDGNSTKKDFTVEVTTNTFSKPISLTPSNNNNTASSLIANLRNNSSTPNVLNNTWGANPVLSRIKDNEYLITNSQNMPKYYDYSKKSMVIDYSDVERAIQNDQALKLAGGNCGSVVATNQCTGVKKTVSYGNTPSATTRYYENTGTSLTRSDLTVSY
jgi:hypothetical protein